ncbi:DNA-binding FadR family transcriptional regulator [Pontibacter ummariensis]|uniref:DNA-binding transcriptional regulator, FadR family n=1 Tax=Pontibacter ummariensis TaxID=1610492 RepID=A0A239L3U0_9BACT|nr:FCD domain-containing protein [Pontibacter ummariensis]PRY04304.1 DNA-binding FadR family transcriptional regulator [Pontibacter ummariensis]SNT25111.1 DNA-binding transcriptional regulator, FadR family [Pontibacter ummariensis]
MENLIDKIKAVDNSSLVDRVETNLIELLVQQNLKVGDSIPKEIDLANSLGVSRTVIREALLRLRMVGLIESRKHRGAIITSPDLLSLLEKRMIPQVLDEATLREVFELRLVLEIGMADFIMERVTKEDIEQLKEITSTEPDLSDSMHFQIQHEINFHGKLYEISGNSTLKKFQSMLLPVFQYVHASGLLKKEVTVKKFVSHKGLVDIIEHGSSEMLRNGMRNHLENHFMRIFN